VEARPEMQQNFALSSIEKKNIANWSCMLLENH
jgi:hypothetical protein